MELQEGESLSDLNGDDSKNIYFDKRSVRQLRSEGVKVHSGKWSDKEKEQLKSNWENFFLNHPSKNSEFYRTLKLNHGKYRLFKVAMMYNLCRTWSSIRMKILHLFDPLFDVELTHSDKFDIEEAYFRKGQKCSTISLNLKLPYLQTCNHIKLINSQRKFSLGRWSEKEDNELLQAILLTHGKESIESIRYSQDLKFDKVADILKSRNHLQCYSRFYFNLQPCISNNFITRKNTWLYSDYIDLISAMDKYECIQEVDWFEIQATFKDFKSVQLLSRKFSRVRKQVSSEKRDTLKELISFVKYNFFPKWEKNAQRRKEYKCKDLKHLFLPQIYSIRGKLGLKENMNNHSKIPNESKLEDSDETSSCSSSDEI